MNNIKTFEDLYVYIESLSQETKESLLKKLEGEK